MKTRTPWKSVLIMAFVIGVVAVGSYFFNISKSNESNLVATTDNKPIGWKFPIVKFPITGTGDIAYSDIRDPGGIPDGLPVRLQIPIIGVDSAIEDALITPDGRMDVPSGSVDVAWFALGPHPGDVGSAVIGGHFGIRDGVPFVFYNLDKLKLGDKVNIVDDRGETITFVVRDIKLFDRNADATTVFSSNDGLAHLNLITCEGVWNQVNGNYPERRVVFTDLVPGTTGSVVPNAPTEATFPRILKTGNSGEDVTALQTVLESRGFLIMPSGIAKGFFGSVTKMAVIKYQASVGLSPVGIFGPLTKASLVESLGSRTNLPNAGMIEGVAPENAPAIGGPFDNSRDGLITILLLATVIFSTYRVLWWRRKALPEE